MGRTGSSRRGRAGGPGPWPPGPGAVDDLGGDVASEAVAHLLDDLVGDGVVLLLVQPTLAVAWPGGLVHRVGDRVGDEQQGELGLGNVGQSAERVDDETGVGTDEAGPQRIRADLVDLEDQPVVPDFGEGVGEVLAVLATGRVGGVGAGRDDHDPVEPAGVGIAKRVGEVRRRVAVAPEDGDLDLALLELGLQGSDEGAVLVVDRTATAEQLVVVGDVLEAVVRDPAAGGDAAQERHDLVQGLGPAE